MSQVQKSARIEAEVEAPVHDVWPVVSDVTRVGEWSHECRSAEWTSGAGRPAPGARFRGRNRAGVWRWSRTCEIVAVDEPHEIAWRTVPTRLFPDCTEWRIALQPSGRGTRITQTFTVLRAPWLLDRLYARLLPTHQDRDGRLAADLARIGTVAQRGAPR
jgi:Polyketide cyclase / dehydrase and lipid transport